MGYESNPVENFELTFNKGILPKIYSVDNRIFKLIIVKYLTLK